MNRSFRSLVDCAAAGALALASAIAAAQTTTLTLATANAPAHWSETQGNTPFMACVKEGTKGTVDFKYFHSGSLSTLPTAMDVLTKGVAQISFIAPSVLSDKMPINNIILLPGMGDNVGQMVKAYRKVIGNPNSPYSKELAALGVKPLVLNVFPPYQLMARREGMKTMESFKNKKIRVAGGAQSFSVSALGAVPVTIGFAEIYLAMQQGTVDAFTFSSMTVKDFSLQEVTKAMSRNGNFGNAVGIFGMDLATFDKMPPAQQKVITDCGLKTEDHLVKYALEFEGKLFDEFAKGGIDVYNYDAATKAALAKKMLLAQADFVLRLERRGLPAQAAFEEYKKALGN